MAHLLRLMALIVVLLAGFISPAHAADIPQQSETTCPAIPAPANPLDRMIPPGGTFYDGYEGIAGAQTSALCVQVRVNPNYNPGWPPFWSTIASYATSTSTHCPDNSTENPDSTTTPKGCKCNAGWKSNTAGNACIVGSPACPDVGASAGNWNVALPESTVGFADRFVCSNVGGSGCTLKIKPNIGAIGSDGLYYQGGPATYTGATCNPNATGNGTESSPTGEKPAGTGGKDTADCKFPKQLGTVNGAQVCLPPAADKPVVTSTGTGTTTTSTDPATGQPVTTTTQTDKTASCTGDSCTVTSTTTTTTTVGTGAPTTKTETKTDTGVDKGTYCKQNPKDPVCTATGTGTGNGTFSGTCTVAPTCTGDAVQCAIAKAQFRETCISEKTIASDDDSTSVVNRALQGLDPGDVDKMKADAHAGAVNVGSFSTTGRGWSRSCPSDPVIPMPWVNSSLTLPFSGVCGPIGILAQVGVALTLLASLVWVIGGRKA